jgi:glyoxylase-like metal-dependent hydrolase (beta-lactamase superfamily II)
LGKLPIHPITVPTPYAVGPVNVYLIEASPLTLIDAGINTDEGKAALLEGLEARGLFVRDLRRILITHAHPDHYGLVHLLKEESGADVYFPEREIARVRGGRQTKLETGRLLVEAGMPMELLLKMDEARKRDPRPPRLEDDVLPIADGDRFSLAGSDGGWTLEAHLMPGHTGGHVVFLEPESRTLFAGDQLLPQTSPNPLLEPSLDEPGERRRSLKEYLESLDAMAAMDLRLVFPGHGPRVDDPNALIDRTIAHHDRRKRVVTERLDRAGKTPYQLAREMYPRVRGYESFLAVSEVVAHLDLVVEEGNALIEVREGVAHYLSAA